MAVAVAPENVQESLSTTAAIAQINAIDVSDIINKIVKVTESELDSNYAKNLKVLEVTFPHIHSQVVSYSSSPYVKIQPSAEGNTVWYGTHCLDHPTKPVATAKMWVKKLLNEERVQRCEALCVFGIGGAYHIEAIQAATSKAVYVFEPSLDVFTAALRARDLSGILNSIKDLFVGEITRELPASVEVVARSHVQILFEESYKKVKKSSVHTQAVKDLRPTIGVVGPFHGGTLPIMGYCLRSLGLLGQRIRELDVSAFDSGYKAIEKFSRDPIRKNLLMGSYVESVSTIVLESIIERPVDIVLCMAQAPLSARALEELRKRGIVTVLWFVEDYLRFTYWKELAKHYDYVFTIQKGECIEALKAAGAREVHYLPPAADPGVHLPVALSAEEKARWGSPISFVGAGYHNRVHLFAALAEMPLKIWGTEWPECRPFDKLVQEKGRRLTPNEYIKIFNSTEININLHSSTERDGVDPYGDFINPRTFELAAAGAFQLVDERSLLSELFTPGEEVITFNSLDDLKEKIAYYMIHPEERAAIAQKARQRVLKEHTYEHRLTKMLEIIYQGSYDKVKARLDQSPWKRMMRRAEASDVELLDRMKVSFERGEEANLDGLVADIVTGNGKLSEVEKKLLFLFHVKKQIVRMAYEEPDPAVKRGA